MDFLCIEVGEIRQDLRYLTHRFDKFVEATNEAFIDVRREVASVKEELKNLIASVRDELKDAIAASAQAHATATAELLGRQAGLERFLGFHHAVTLHVLRSQEELRKEMGTLQQGQMALMQEQAEMRQEFLTSQSDIKQELVALRADTTAIARMEKRTILFYLGLAAALFGVLGRALGWY